MVAGSTTTQQFTAVVVGSSNTAVTWSVVAGANSTAGTITSSGVYTAPSQAGTNTVTATSAADATKTASSAVTITALGISPAATVILPQGGTQTYTASIPGVTSTPVTWSVDQVAGGNTTTGTISAAGVYTAPLSNTTHTITATSSANATITASTSVIVTSLTIAPTTATLNGLQQQQFTFTLPGVTNPAINWSATGGTVSTAGLFTAPTAAGSYTVTATSAANPALTASAAVSVYVFTITPTSGTVQPSTTLQFTVSLTGLTNDSYTLAVDGVQGGNATTGTISSTGLYTAPTGIGPHKITATSVQDTALTVTASVTVVNFAQSSVLTYHNDDARDGQYLEELTLTPANVNATQFGKLLSYPVDGQVYAQPLYVSGLSIAGGTHDVVFVTTQNNSVYAFDADATSPQTAQTFWQDLALGPHVFKGDIEGVNPYIGILSTPVIDASTNTMYLVAEASPNNPTPFNLYALDITTGAKKFGSPVIISGSVPGTGDQSVNGTVSLGTDCYQRMGLALNPVTNAIEIAFGSCSHGWVLAYDKTSLQQMAIFNSTPDWKGGTFWASDGAPAIDDTTGDLYLMSGTDTGDQNSNDNYLPMLYNNSFLHLGATDLSITSFFTPDDTYNLALQDIDLGSGSNILVPGSSTVNVTLGGGKDGNVFVLNRDNMGGFNTGSNNVLQTVQICANGSNNIFSTPVYWNGNINGPTLYFHCNGYGISAYSWNAGTTQMSTTPTSTGSAIFMTHGATPSLSANGAVNGIIWEIDNSNYIFKSGVPTGAIGFACLRCHQPSQRTV